MSKRIGDVNNFNSVLFFYYRFHGTVRNPYNLDYHTGGSSGGSASAVAAGQKVVAY